GDDRSVVNNVMATPDRRDTRMDAMQLGSHGYDLWPAMDARAEELRVPKTRYSAFIQGSSELDSILRSRDIDTLVITGTATNVCCESTARDAMMLNYRVAMVSDGTATYNDAFHASSMLALYRTFSDVLTTEQALAALSVDAGGASHVIAAE